MIPGPLLLERDLWIKCFNLCPSIWKLYIKEKQQSSFCKRLRLPNQALHLSLLIYLYLSLRLNPLRNQAKLKHIIYSYTVYHIQRTTHNLFWDRGVLITNSQHFCNSRTTVQCQPLSCPRTVFQWLMSPLFRLGEAIPNHPTFGMFSELPEFATPCFTFGLPALQVDICRYLLF